MLSGHFDETILSDYKKMKFIIDVIGKVRYIDYGERRYRESRTASILGIENGPECFFRSPVSEKIQIVYY